jgi:ribosomal protein S18 acetylase RimI-like enzyme
MNINENDKIVFEKAKCEDFERLFGLYKGGLRRFIDEIWGWDENWQRDDFKKYFHPRNIYIVLYDRRLAGYIQVDKDQDKWHIRMMVVSEELQGNGLGTLMLKKIIDESNAEKKVLTLSVFKINNKAQNLYKKMNFQEILSNENSIIMRLER